MAQNRLNLPSMVNRHIGSDATSTKAFFNPLTMHSPNNYEPSNSQMKPASVDVSVKRIVAMVHTNLDSTKYKLEKIKQTRIAHEDEIKTDLKPSSPSNAGRTGSRTSTFNGKLTKQAGGNNKSIPEIKARWHQKFQQRMRRSGSPPSDIKNFSNTKRLQEVQRQRNLLKEILEEHAKIQRDRNSITKEIHTMKEYLSEIRFKLDSSLKKLGTHKTIVEENSELKKTGNLHRTKKHRANPNRR